MPRHIYSTVPLWQIIDNGVLRPKEAKSYVLDESKRPHPPIGWRSLHFGKLDKPVTMREVLADYQFFDANKDYSLSYGNPGNEVRKAQSKQYNATAWNDHILNPSLANVNIFSGRPMEIFNSSDTAGLSGDVTTVILTIKSMVAKIQSLKLPETDTTKLINDVYDKYLAPLINKFPALKDPDTGADINDISYLLTLAPPMTNANPTVVPVQLNKTTFTGSTGSSGPDLGLPTSTLGPGHMDAAEPAKPPAAPELGDINIFQRSPIVIKKSPTRTAAEPEPESMMERLRRQLKEKFAEAEPEIEPHVIQQQHDIAKKIKEEPSGAEGKREAPQLTAQELETRRKQALKAEAKALGVYNKKDPFERMQKKVEAARRKKK